MDVPITSGWRFIHIGVGGEPVDLDGVDPWKHKWRSTGEKPIVVSHPSYPQQRHEMWIWDIVVDGRRVRFAAGEFSNCVWGFYLP